MAAGKTVVGRELAAILGAPFVDLDAEVERLAGATVAEIFRDRGEEAFRELESEALLATGDLPAAVVATGGGTPTLPRNAAALRRLGTTVFLDVPFELLLARLDPAERASRPLFRSPEEARRLHEKRLPRYRESDLVVPVREGASARDLAATIAALIREKPCDT